MYSLSLLTVDLKIAKERLLNVFEIADSIDSQPKNSRRSFVATNSRSENYWAKELKDMIRFDTDYLCRIADRFRHVP
jgi:hypothetical protein